MCTFVSVREKVELCVCERGVGGSVWVDVGRCACARARARVCATYCTSGSKLSLCETLCMYSAFCNKWL